MEVRGMRSESEMIEAMQQAMKYLKPGASIPVDVHTTKLLADALRAAITEASMQRLTDVQQEMEATIKDYLPVEPVAYVTGYSKGRCIIQTVDFDWLLPVGMALYRSPPNHPERVLGMVEPVAWLSQGGDVSRSKKHFNDMGFVDLIPLYDHPPRRAIEAKLKEKNG
jgi:hypothetical protein